MAEGCRLIDGDRYRTGPGVPFETDLCCMCRDVHDCLHIKNPLPGLTEEDFTRRVRLFLISRDLPVPQELAPSPDGRLPRRQRACPSVALDKKVYSVVLSVHRSFSWPATYCTTLIR